MKFRYLCIFITTLSIISALGISFSSVFADKSNVDKLTLDLPISCTIDGGSSSVHTQSVVNNQYYNNLGGAPTTLTTYCNDAGGYIIYAVSSGDNIEGNTNLVGNNGSNIPTGVYSQGDTTSSWAFRIDRLDNTLELNPGYSGGFSTVPSAWDWVAKKESGTVDSTTGSKITTTYAAYISGTQAAGTYTGQMKYMLFHPSGSQAPTTITQAFSNNGKQKYNGYYKIQDMNSTICSEVNVFGAASEAELIDIRDNNVYWVAKLEDGHCWMTENLDLDLINDTTTEDYVTLTSENTNLKLYGSLGYDNNNGYTCSNDSPTCENGVITWVPERATSATLSSWGNDFNNPYSFDRGLYTPNGEMDGHGYTGNYYNWTAAIASNASNSYNAGTTATQVAANSICPAGWRLPNTEAMTGGYEFSKLLYAYGVTTDDKNTSGYAGSASQGLAKITSSPLYLVRSGNLTGYSINDSGSRGDYWSSAVFNTYDAYYLHFNSNSVNPANRYGRSEGRPLRCLAE